MGNPTENAETIDTHEKSSENSEMATGAMPVESGEAATSPTVSILSLVDGGVNSATVSLTPPLNADGTVKRKRGRPRKNPDTAPSTVTQSPSKTAVQKKATKAATIGMASTILNTVQAGMGQLVGEEWAFQNQEEADRLRESLVNFIESKGGAELTPEMDLILATAGYALPRFKHKNTQEKFGAFFGSVWNKVSGWFKK